MKVIFTQNTGASLVDDMKDVKSGYARFLFQYGRAVPAYPEFVEAAAAKREERVKAREAVKAQAREVAASLASVVLAFSEKANAEGHLFGSIAEAQIIEALKETAKIEVAKEQVKMEHLKECGDHVITLKLAEGVEATVNVTISALEA